MLVVAATFAGAAMQSATGFGFALVLSPALFATLDPSEAVSVLLFLGLPLGLLVLADTRLDPVRWRDIAPVLAAALPGLGLGALVLAVASKPVLQVVVGAVVLAAVAWQARRRLREGPDERTRSDGDPRAGALAGLASGTLTTSISLSGPPLVLWLEGLGLRPVEIRASLAVCFLALNLTGLAVLLAGGSGDLAEPSLLLPLLAALLAGHVAGVVITRRIDERRFSAVVLAVAAGTAVASVAAGLSA